MQEKLNELLMDFNKMNKEFDELYHKVASKMGISDSAFSIFYTIYDLGDGCLQKDICYEFFANKQTVNSSIRKLVQEGYIYLKQGVGRDKHIFLTEAGKQFVEKYIVPSSPKRKCGLYRSKRGRTKGTFTFGKYLYGKLEGRIK